MKKDDFLSEEQLNAFVDGDGRPADAVFEGFSAKIKVGPVQGLFQGQDVPAILRSVLGDLGA